MERRRTSINSDSSVEPMDISTKTTSSTDANSSAAVKSTDANDSDNFESDRPKSCGGGSENDHGDVSGNVSSGGGGGSGGDHHCNNNDDDHSSVHSGDDDYKYQNYVRRENLRQLDNHLHHHHHHNIMRKKFRLSMPNKNNNNLESLDYDKFQTFANRISQIGGIKDMDGGEPVADNYPNSNVSEMNLNSNLDKNDVKYNCPICNTISATQHEFTEHIRSHNNADDTQNFTCKICFKVLSSASSLDRHVLVHTGERPFTCKYCHVTFTTNGNMHRHVRTHKQRDTNISGSGRNIDNYESDGGSTDSSGSSANNNYPSVDGKRKISFDDDSSNLKRRLKTINNNNIIKSPIPTPIQHHPQQPPLQLCCPVCIRMDFPNMLALENHMDREHPSIQAKCRYCDVVFKSHKALNTHKCAAGHYKTFGSQITHGFRDMTFVDFSSEKFPLIAKSMCEQSIRMPITNQKFECPKCYRAFPCVSAVDIHMKECGIHPVIHDNSPHDFSVHKRRRSDTSDEDAQRSDFFRHLDLQNKSMTTSSSLGGSTPYERSMVDSMTSLYNDKSPPKHVDIKQEPRTPQHQLHHQYDNKDLADIQSIINVTSSGGFLRQFDKSMPLTSPLPQSKELPFTREEEEVQDAFTAEFRKMKLRGEFPCKLCTAVFPNLRALKGHNRIHVGAAGSGPYRCNMCPYSIHDKAALIRHMRTHNGDRPYECSICNYAFTTKANCERHLRNRHGKTTREEVKRSIIYHPNEDSSCDDPIKKMQIYNSSYDDDDSMPKDSSTPVSHLKEMLTPPSEKPVKIQVKSMEQLIRPINYEKHDRDKDIETIHALHVPDHRPIDLSMDALDLTKKSNPKRDIIDEEEDAGNEEDDEDDEEELPTMPKIDLTMFEKNQQILMAQQQFLSETFPKIDPSHYFQLSQLYRNFMFPSATGFPLHPIFLQNSFLPPPTADFKDMQSKEMPPMPSMYPGGLMMNSIFPGSPIGHSSTLQQPTPPSQPQSHPSIHQRGEALSPPQRSTTPPAPQIPQQLSQPPIPNPHQMTSPRQHPQQQQQLHSTTNQQSQAHSPGPVKMVIKNGVLMPKQKQRRYRTERPFACEHCSARFTLRSNMERHIKQQHPQYWAQRQRNGHNLLRRGSGGAGVSSSSHSSQPNVSQSSAQLPNIPPNQLSAISDQVKYAILAQQLKCRSEKSDYFGSSGGSILHPHNNNNNNDLDMDNHHMYQSNEALNDEDDDNESELIIDEDSEPEDLSNKSPELQEVSPTNEAAKKVAENILEQAMRVAAPQPPAEPKDFDLKIAPNLIPRADSVGKYLKNPQESHYNKIQEEGDLVSVSKLVDNATNAMPFGSYFRPDVTQIEHSDEEGLVASGSASESNNSGTEDPNPTAAVLGKKKSAYSLAPNRVSCPYCQRMFPWTSSLRRHILTHTGQKPFKCSHCPLLFTTKSNCDRHLLRKHGNVESAVSLYVPIDDVPEPMAHEKQSREHIEHQDHEEHAELKLQRVRGDPHDQQREQREQRNQRQDENEEEDSPVEVTDIHLQRSVSPALDCKQQQQQQQPPLSISLNIPVLKTDAQLLNSSELPFKCHLCDGSFSERLSCLEHIKTMHTQEFALLMAKGAIETESTSDHHLASAEDDDNRIEGRGKYPDYANRKVMCAFCMRRFWSTEDLRRHMRTHSGERPFQCDICMRKFTLKHSMLRHQKKHTHHPNHPIGHGNSASDLSDDEQPPSQPSHSNQTASNLTIDSAAAAVAAATAKLLKIPDLIPKELSWKLHSERRDNFAAALRKAEFFREAGLGGVGIGGSEETSELIGNLLGISDQGILNKVLLSSADEAAKLLGVEK